MLYTYRFLKIQEAFNVLSNEQKRRAYDSQLPFDETTPSEEKVNKVLEKGPHKFFKLFDPVFKRNARFAVQKPVPELGNLDTPIEQVYKFYAYWVGFESWRDFTGIGAEHNPDHANSREEKRYMQKENEKLAKKLKKKEMDRIIEMVQCIVQCIYSMYSIIQCVYSVYVLYICLCIAYAYTTDIQSVF